jgi:hypothetical protein
MVMVHDGQSERGLVIFAHSPLLSTSTCCHAHDLLLGSVTIVRPLHRLMDSMSGHTYRSVLFSFIIIMHELQNVPIDSPSLSSGGSPPRRTSVHLTPSPFLRLEDDLYQRFPFEFFRRRRV